MSQERERILEEVSPKRRPRWLVNAERDDAKIRALVDEATDRAYAMQDGAPEVSALIARLANALSNYVDTPPVPEASAPAEMREMVDTLSADAVSYGAIRQKAFTPGQHIADRIVDEAEQRLAKSRDAVLDCASRLAGSSGASAHPNVEGE